MYQTAKKFEQAGLLTEGVRAGIVNPHIIRWIRVYETWRNESKTLRRYEAVLKTAVLHKMSVQMVYRIIGAMS